MSFILELLSNSPCVIQFFCDGDFYLRLFHVEDTLLNLRPEVALPKMLRRPPHQLLPDELVRAQHFLL